MAVSPVAVQASQVVLAPPVPGAPGAEAALLVEQVPPVVVLTALPVAVKELLVVVRASVAVVAGAPVLLGVAVARSALASVPGSVAA